MRALSAQEMLAVWERGIGQIPLERALALLGAACTECDRQTLATKSLGLRDALLLQLREKVFGPYLTGYAVCRSCGEPLEVRLHVKDLVRSDSDVEYVESPPIPFLIQGYELLLRPLNSLDLSECAADNIGEPRRLFSRCLIAASAGGVIVTEEQVPDEVALAVMEDVVKADPRADIQIALCCAACRTIMHEAFDIVSFFWSEIDVWARRVLREVHLLASAYGWSEGDILSMSPVRRQFYLEISGA
jgi:hypothetical protein